MITAITNFDARILYFIQEHVRTPLLDPLMKFFSFLGNGGWFWITLCVILALNKKTRRVGLTVGFSLAVCFAAQELVIKNIVQRPRPFTTFSYLHPLITRPHSFSFPSGHTTSSFACALTLFRETKKRYSVPALVLASLIAFSRLYVGVHYPTDVLAGILIALLFTPFTWRFMRRQWAKRDERAREAAESARRQNNHKRDGSRRQRRLRAQAHRAA